MTPIRRVQSEDIEVISPNLNRHLSGVTATIVRLIPIQARDLGIFGFGYLLPEFVPQINFWQLVRLRRVKPAKRPFRIWHARRNIEMLLGLLLKWLLGHRHKLIFTSASQRHHTYYTRFLISQMDAVIATSNATASYLKRRAFVIRHGIDVTLFRPAMNRTNAWMKSGLPGRYGIGCFGRIRYQKGTDLFIAAMLQLLPRYPDATAVILGRVTWKNRRYFTEQKQKIAEAGLEGRIVFCDEVPVHEIAEWYARLSLFVAPQRWEGFGLTPLEAMACAVPVVASDAGAFPELIVDGETGRIVPKGDAAALTDAIEYFLQAPERMTRAGRAAADHVRTNFTLEKEATALRAVYESVWADATAADLG